MNTKDYQLLVEHDYWASVKIADMLLAMDIIPERPKRIFDHLIGAQDIWLSRINTLSPVTDVWPVLMPNVWKHKLKENRDSFYEIASSEEKINTVISYKDTSGRELNNRVGELLLHLSLHAQYHRGQVIAYAREQIKEVPVTDMIAYLRQ